MKFEIPRPRLHLHQSLPCSALSFLSIVAPSCHAHPVPRDTTHSPSPFVAPASTSDVASKPDSKLVSAMANAFVFVSRLPTRHRGHPPGPVPPAPRRPQVISLAMPTQCSHLRTPSSPTIVSSPLRPSSLPYSRLLPMLLYCNLLPLLLDFVPLDPVGEER